MAELDLSEDGLRKRLFNASNEVNDEKVAEASKKECLDSIIKAIYKSRKRNEIVNGFFEGFPYGNHISNVILSYKGKALEKVMNAIGRTAVCTENAGAVKKVAGALNQKEVRNVVGNYKGKALEKVMWTIEQTAFLTEDADAVKAKAEEYLMQAKKFS